MIRPALAICAAALSLPALAETVVLGLPLGGKMPQPIKTCSSGPTGVAMCWLAKPFIGKDGSRHGALRVPSTDHMPEWAAFGTFNVIVSSDWRLDRLEVSTRDHLKMPTIQRSISSRFGVPSITTEVSAQWKQPGAFIELLCDRRIGCVTSFESEQHFAERMRQAEGHKKTNAARPIAP